MSETRKNGKIHYAWKILFACCLINIAALGQTNSDGIFYPAICKDMGFVLSSLTLCKTFCGAAAAIAALAVHRIYKRFNTRLVIGIGLIFYQLSFAVMPFLPKLWMWYAASVVTGISAALVWYVPVPMLINNWFIKSKKTALSISAVACGISGILMSLVLGKTIDSMGWQFSYLLRSGFCVLLTIPVLFIIRKNPEELGMTAYGALPADAAADGSVNAVDEKEKVYGASETTVRRKQILIYTIFAVILAVGLNFPCSLVTLLPSYADSIGLSTMIGSVLTSLAMIGNIGSKAVLGPWTERSGIRVTGSAIMFLILAGFIALGLGVTNIGVIYAASITTGITACANVLIIPNLLDQFVSGDDYVSVLSKCSTGTLVAGAFKVFVTSKMYEVFGSYQPVFLAYAVLEVINILILLVVFKKAKKKTK